MICAEKIKTTHVYIKMYSFYILCFILFFFCSSSDMEKFPVRMKDNDLLVTELFQDPFKEEVTALSIFMPPNCCESLPL